MGRRGIPRFRRAPRYKRALECTHERGLDRLSPLGRVRRLFDAIAKIVSASRRVVHDGQQHGQHLVPDVGRFGSSVQSCAARQRSRQFRVLRHVNGRRVRAEERGRALVPL